MYEYIPKRGNQKAIHLIFLCLIGGFLILGLTSVMPTLPFRWAFQITGIACLAAAIYVYVRYVTRFFRYAIVKREDGSLDLTVTECQRKGRITVCRLSLAGIERVERVEENVRARQAELKKEIRKEGRKLFYYNVTLAPSSLCYVFATECGERLAIVIEADEQLLRMLRANKAA